MLFAPKNLGILGRTEAKDWSGKMARITKALPQLILLRWFDSTIGPATAVYTPEEALAEKMVVLETVGWLIAETTEPYGGCYILAASQHGADWRGIQLIPKANVISRHVFDEPSEVGK